jgi:flagellar protein FlaG
MKEVLSPSLSPVELQLGKREDTPNVTLRPVEQNEKSSRYSDRDKSFEEGLNGTLIAELKENLNKLNTYIPVTSTNLSFEFDDKGDPPFIRVLDKENNEVIREIPS